VGLKAATLVLVVALSTLVFDLGATAHAQDKSAKGAAKGGGDKKRTSIDFEDELVEGELKKPELFYLLQKKQFNFKRLIKLREDFLPEMRRDADEIRRGRSKN
jgi:hypothetical protein